MNSLAYYNKAGLRARGEDEDEGGGMTIVLRQAKMSAVKPRPRSPLTLCCVGFVFCYRASK